MPDMINIFSRFLCRMSWVKFMSKLRFITYWELGLPLPFNQCSWSKWLSTQKPGDGIMVAKSQVLTSLRGLFTGFIYYKVAKKKKKKCHDQMKNAKSYLSDNRRFFFFNICRRAHIYWETFISWKKNHMGNTLCFESHTVKNIAPFWFFDFLFCCCCFLYARILFLCCLEDDKL